MIEFKHLFVDTRGKDAEALRGARAKMDALADRISKGESFESIAASSSEDKDTKDRGGYSGFLRVDQAPAKALGKELVTGMLALTEGQISGALRSSMGYHIVKVVRILPAKLYGLDEKTPPYYQQTPAEQISAYLAGVNQQQAINAAIQATARELRKGATIRIEEKNLGFTLVK